MSGAQAKTNLTLSTARTKTPGREEAGGASFDQGDPNTKKEEGKRREKCGASGASRGGKKKKKTDAGVEQKNEPLQE